MQHATTGSAMQVSYSKSKIKKKEKLLLLCVDDLHKKKHSVDSSCYF
jgi:hypothetical protein